MIAPNDRDQLTTAFGALPVAAAPSKVG